MARNYLEMHLLDQLFSAQLSYTTEKQTLDSEWVSKKNSQAKVTYIFVLILNMLQECLDQLHALGKSHLMDNLLMERQQHKARQEIESKELLKQHRVQAKKRREVP